MGSIIKVNEYKDFNNNDILTSDGSGNVTINAAALKSTPAFSAYLSGSQTINQDTHTTAQFNTEVFDTDSNFDVSTYRFTPTTSGKYLIGAEMMVSKDAAELKVALMRIRKNGSTVREVRVDIRNSTGKQFGPSMVITPEANGSSDYFDVSFYADTTESTAVIGGGSSGAIFYGYKLIGV